MVSEEELPLRDPESKSQFPLRADLFLITRMKETAGEGKANAWLADLVTARLDGKLVDRETVIAKVRDICEAHNRARGWNQVDGFALKQDLLEALATV